MTARLRSALQHLALAVVPVTLLLLVLEAAVRLTDADQTCPNRFSRSNYWVCDPILHFRVNPAQRPLGQPLNSDGFRGPEFTAKAPGVFRILALGDSCTFGYVGFGGDGFVLQPYPLRLQRLVERRVGKGRVEVLNAGVPGYTSFHGVMLLRTRLRGLEPDLVTVRYGWNDLFLSARGEEGGALYREPDTRLGLLLEDLLLRTRLYGFVRRLGLELRAWREPADAQRRKAFSDQTEWTPTIPIEDFDRNLRRIIGIGRDRGARVWLLTSPRGFTADDETKRTMSERNRIDFDRLMEIHERYNEAVRRVGREEGAVVVDMERIYRRYADALLFGPTDATHPTQAGHLLEAEALYAALVERGLIRPDRGEER